MVAISLISLKYQGYFTNWFSTFHQIPITDHHQENPLLLPNHRVLFFYSPQRRIGYTASLPTTYISNLIRSTYGLSGI